MPNRLDWAELEDDVVVPSIGAIAVYENAKGNIVIRQQALALDVEDGVVVVPRRYVPDLVRKILATADMDQGTIRIVRSEGDNV